MAPDSAQSQEERARAAFRLGRAHYDNGDFVKAAKEFERAFELSGKHQLLYNVYLAYRDANMTQQAADALRGYLDNTPDVPNRAQLVAKLRALQRTIKTEEPVTPPPPPPPPPVKPEPEPEPTEQPAEEPVAEEPQEAEPEPAEEAAEPAEEAPAEEAPAEEAKPEEEAESKDTDLVPLILMGSGGAMIVGSIITGVMASSAQGELEDECPDKQCPADADLEALKDTQSRGKTMMVVTDILLFGGIAAAGTGLVLFLLEGAEEEQASEGVTAGLGCSPTGCAGAVRVAF